MRKRARFWTARSAAVIVALAAGAVAVVLPASPSAAACTVSWSSDPLTTVVNYSGGALNIRYQPYTSSCINGVINSGHVLQYSCYTTGTTVNGWSTWTYLKDWSNGKWGWSSNYYLPNHGSYTRCSAVQTLGSV